MTGKLTNIPPGLARAVSLQAGNRARIINTHGGQVVDTWAFAIEDLHEHLSMEHSRSATYRLLFQPGDTLMSNRFRPMFTITSDTSPGIHDTLHAACSPGSNEFYRQPVSHPNCENNLKNNHALSPAPAEKYPLSVESVRTRGSRRQQYSQRRTSHRQTR